MVSSMDKSFMKFIIDWQRSKEDQRNINDFFLTRRTG